MAHQWRGVIAEYADRLPAHVQERVVTLGEGGTPLVPSPTLSQRTGAEVFIKVEGMNPTGSFKDRGMTTAMSGRGRPRRQGRGLRVHRQHVGVGRRVRHRAPGMVCAVLVPDGKIAMGKLSQAIAHGATLLQVDGNFDDCLIAARKLAESYPVELVNSVNPDRIEGQKTGAFEIVDALGDAPDIHVLPVGNAGNITAYWKGYREYAGLDAGAAHTAVATRTPIMWGFQAAGAAPIVARPPDRPARDHRHGDPDRQPRLLAAGRGGARRVRRSHRGGHRRADPRRAPRAVGRGRRSSSSRPPRPASPGCSQLHDAGRVPAGARIVITVTGHGLKDPQWALRTPDGSDVVPGAGLVRRGVHRHRSRPGLRPAMRLGADHVRVRVPATSANLGPGFDAFGIALGLVRRARGAGARLAGRHGRGHGGGRRAGARRRAAPRRQLAARRARPGRRVADRAAPRLPQPHPARPRARVVGRRRSSPGSSPPAG